MATWPPQAPDLPTIKYRGSGNILLLRCIHRPLIRSSSQERPELCVPELEGPAPRGRVERHPVQCQTKHLSWQGVLIHGYQQALCLEEIFSTRDDLSSIYPRE